jgi:type I restriction enzyme S subunit
MEGWAQRRLGDLFEVKAGGDLQVLHYSPFLTEHSRWAIYANSLENKGLYGYTSKPRFSGNAVTITGRGDIGHAEYRPDDFDAIVRLLVLLPKVDVDCRYVTYYINSLVHFSKESTGVPQLTAPKVKSIKINLPNSKTEQTAIANILSKVDETIAAVQSRIASAERLKKGLMQNLLTGKMKPDGTFRTADEFYIDEKFGKVPVGWEVKKGIDITSKITKGQSPKWLGFDYQDQGILFVTSENIQDGYIDISNPKYLPLEFNAKIRNSQLRKGDVLINIVGASIGRCAIFDLDVDVANTNQAVCLFRPNDENDSVFLSLYLQDETVRKRLFRTQVETARANLSLSDFRKFKFIIPKKQEQIKIANAIMHYNDEIKNLKAKIDVLSKLKKSLMQNLLTGKVRIK